MPRYMSFTLTNKQLLDRTKTVTRRRGWYHLKPGDLLIAVKQIMGLKKGEEVERLGTLKVLSTRKDPLEAIEEDDGA